MRNLEVFDTTLRDGAQGEGISFSVEDKLAVCRELDALGITFIESGNPASNPKDAEFFRRAGELDLKNSRLVAFGATRRKQIKAEQDPNVLAILEAKTDYVAIFGKCWSLQVYDILKTTEAENLEMIEDTVRFFKNHGKSVFFDAEHFFDGYRQDPGFPQNAVKAAIRGGADCIVLCDTNGGAFPWEVYEISRQMINIFPEVKFGCHFHNDGAMAEANTVMAVRAGISSIQGTFLGFGERCGNAKLSSIIPTLQLKCGYKLIPDKNLEKLTHTAIAIAEISNVTIPKNEPFIGESAFAHKAGMHADGVLKRTDSFEHIKPESVGNERHFPLSEIAGRGVILKKIGNLIPGLEKNSEQLSKITAALKDMEHMGYQYDGAQQSFEILVRKLTGRYTPFFELINYKIISQNPYDKDCSSSATVKIRVGDTTQLSAAEGLGPVNAIDKALRSALEVFYPQIKNMYLYDYKVRVMDSGKATASNVRVLISSTDGENVWTTVGCSFDIIEASWLALVDSIEYKLIKYTER